MDYNKFFQSKGLQGFLVGIGCFVVFLVAFRAGMSVGFHKADYSYRFGDNYCRNFAGPKDGFRGGLEGRGFMDAHGIIGQIIKIDGALLIINDKDGVEKIVKTTAETAIVSMRANITFGELKNDDLIVIIGEPNVAGQIEAKLIRIMPPMPQAGPGRPAKPADLEADQLRPDLFPLKQN